MITRHNRFHGRASIQRLYKSGRAVRTTQLGLRYAPSRRDTYRLAVVVSKKTAKSAVVRNRIRRRIYEYIRLRAGAFAGSHDLIITVYDAALAKADHRDVTTEVEKVLHKAGLV